MDAEKLRNLENASYKFASYVADLVEVESVSDLIIPADFSSRQQYIDHLGNMIGAYRMEIGMAYNDIAEWQNI